ncbi:MAG TPA: glucose 1-dehydrogenase [Candidatus Krumholzibacteria bacterium]|nr:glucose 1-dehydrogenase [Candidatus Krumholzibacteria bacterium]
MTLEGKVAIVTGASSGIGKSIAQLYAREGAAVVLSDLNGDSGERVAAELRDAGARTIFVKANVAEPADSERTVKAALETFGRLDCACNNAGIGGEQSPTADISLEGWQKVIGINLSGVFYGMKYQIPAMLKSGGGAIVNIASILGQVGFANSSGYVAAKHGVVGLSKNAAIEYAAKNVRVNSVGPGFIHTPLIGALERDRHVNEMLISLHPMGRLGNPEEVAELVLWLSSDKSSFVTGGYYAVDGGYLAR